MFDDIKAYAWSLSVEKYMVDILAKIVAIPSTIHNSKMKKEVLTEFLEFAKCEGYDVEEHGDSGSVLLHNYDGKIEVGILVHLDVVPAGEGWNFEPFKLTRFNGLLIGRGVLDDKGPAVVALAAMRYFMYRKVSLPFTIRLFLGCDEESGMQDMKNFLLSHKAPDFSFTPDNVFPVCCGENGIATIVVSAPIGNDIAAFMGKTIINSTSSYAKVVFYHDLDTVGERSYIHPCIHKHRNFIETRNSKTRGDKPFDAIQVICKYMYESEFLSNDSQKAIELMLMLSAIGGEDDENRYARLSEPNYLKFRCDSVRVRDNELCAKYQVRYSALSDFNGIIADIEKKIKTYNGSITVLNNRSGTVFDVSKSKVDCLLDAYKKTTNVNLTTYFDDYGTYATVCPNAVGFGARTLKQHNLLGEGRGNMHQKDEYISLEEMKIALETYIRAICNLAHLYKYI